MVGGRGYGWLDFVVVVRAREIRMVSSITVAYGDKRSLELMTYVRSRLEVGGLSDKGY